MMEGHVQGDALPTGTQLRRRYQILTAGTSVVSLGVISGYLMALLSLTSEQWTAFFWFVGTVAPGLTVIQWIAIDPPLWNPLRAYLDARAAGEADDEQRREAFSAVVYLPRHSASWGFFWYALGGNALAVTLWAFFGITGYSAVVIGTASITGGFVGVLFHGFSSKSMLTPISLVRRVSRRTSR